jgi:fructose/tagatose bisphosphate aldolase
MTPSPFESAAELDAAAKGVLALDGERVRVLDAARFRRDLIDRLARTAVFGAEEPLRDLARRRIRAAAEASGVVSASIDPLYRAMGRGEVKGFTVPAINVRALVYDFARAIAATAVKEDVRAVIFELARSEMGYTGQSCAEFACVVTAAALKEGYEGPLFVQGDHFQVNAKKYAVDPAAEVAAVRALCEEAVAAGYGNIDVDTSTIVDLSKVTLDEQQRNNYTHAAELTARIREVEPDGMTISVGGEIGEVGLANSTVGELRAYMDGYAKKLEALSPGAVGISKISVQTGTSHGGVPLPDGRVADAEIDFDTLRELSRVARAEYGIAGCVQHGASTLPDEVFDLFPKQGTAEIHLATAFQTLILSHPAFPKDLTADIDAWCMREKKAERKPGMTDAQFLYKTRKFAWAAFKRRCWDLPEENRAAIRASLSSMVSMLCGKLGVRGTKALVARHASVPSRGTQPTRR